jgi:hypothetical protein
MNMIDTIANQRAATVRLAPRLTISGASLFILLLAVLHVVKPELEPSWRMVSEYAIGRNGWIMAAAFLSLSVSCAALFFAVKPHVRTIGGRIGLLFLLISAISLAAAAIFTIDPVTANKEELTTHGNLHGLVSMIGIPGLSVASWLITLSLTRKTSWTSTSRSLKWTAVLIWFFLLLMIGMLAVTLPLSGGKFGPNVWVGWPNRLLMIAYCAWLITTAWEVRN